MTISKLCIMFCFLILSARAGSGCGLYKTECIPDRKSMMEYVLEENADNELILTTKYEYFYENENCSGDISFQMTSNYSLVQVDKKRNDYYFDITTLSQLITFNNDYYLKQHECTDIIKTRVLYFASSSLLDAACKEGFDSLRDINKSPKAKITIQSEKSLVFPDLYFSTPRGYYTASYQTSLGCVQVKTSSSTVWLILIIIVLIIVIIGLVYYQRNYRYVPITERKRIDLPKTEA